MGELSQLACSDSLVISVVDHRHGDQAQHRCDDPWLWRKQVADIVVPQNACGGLFKILSHGITGDHALQHVFQIYSRHPLRPQARVQETGT